MMLWDGLGIAVAAALLSAATGVSRTGDSPPDPPPPVIATRLAQLTIREQIIIRVPRRTPPPRIVWHERRGDRCVAIAALAGAAVNAPDSVDFILRGGRMVRAKLDALCPALDYYSGFYVVPTKDGRMCADRDAIHDRSGNECGIARFRRLLAAAAH